MSGSPEERIDRYVLLEPIGKGGMGVVHRAFDPRLTRHVALKLVSGAADRRLLREARAMAQLSHPAVVQVYDAGIVGDRVYIAMELIDGVDLRAWLRDPRSWQAVLEVFIAAGRGLAAAHAVGIVHRDFKPSNALVSSSGRVVVGDFGLARPVGVDDLHMGLGRDAEDRTLTLSGPGMGTPRYMAPEQRSGTAVDARADQYSFCVALDEALVAAGAPQPIRDVVFRGLAPEPASRFPSLVELVVALERVGRAWASPRRTRPRLLAMGAAVAAAALVLFASFGMPESDVASAAVVTVEAEPDLAPDAEPEPAVVVGDAPAAELVPDVASGIEGEIEIEAATEPAPRKVRQRVVPRRRAEPPRKSRKNSKNSKNSKKHKKKEKREKRPEPDGLIRDLWSEK